MIKSGSIINHSLKYGFITKLNDVNNYYYGPLGSIMFDEIMREWKKFVIYKEPKMFYIQNNTLKPEYNERMLCQVNFLNDHQTPYGIGQHYFAEINKANESKTFIKFCINNFLCVDYFCAPQSFSTTLDYFKAKRIAWWKQYLGSPSNINFKQLNSTSIQGERSNTLLPSPETTSQNTHNQDWGFAITYEYPWGENVVETITKKSINDNCDNECRKTSISIQTSMENILSVFLTDAYSLQTPLKTTDPNSQVMLRLHPKIAPFKVSLLVPGDKGGHNQDLSQVSNYILKEMAKESLYTYDLSNLNSEKESIQSLLTKSDHMGIPYNVIVKEAPLENGIVYLRSRDTGLTEEVHVAEIRKAIARYVNAY